MPLTQFNRPVLMQSGDLYVSGPFDPEGLDLVGEVTVRFVIIQKASAYATVDPRTAPPIAVDGVGSWQGGGDWECTLGVSRVPPDLRATPPGSTDQQGLCRGIGAAVWIRNVPNERLPVFETLTWCVTTEVVGEGQSNVPYESY